METVAQACLTAALLSGQLPKVVAQPSPGPDLGLDKPEFGGLLSHELGRLLHDHPRLVCTVDKARATPDDERAWSSVRVEMEKALRQDPDKLDALWAVLVAANHDIGGPSGLEPDPINVPGSRWGGPGGVRRKFASIFAPMGAVLAVVLMAALAGLAILGVEIGKGETLLRWFAIVVLACLPGWLFLRFIVFRAGSLWTEYVLNLHRLRVDEHQYLPAPPMSSAYYGPWSRGGGSVLSASPNIYRQKFEVYYGKNLGRDTDGRRSVFDKSIPQVLLATAVLAVGWTAVLARKPLLSGPLVLPLDSLRFGFMGAYVFILQMLIRRFFQSDLKASAYIGVVARIATVVITVFVVHQALGVSSPISAETEVSLAFLIGFFPLLGMQIVQRAVTVTFRRLVHTLKTPYPLSDLDGLNIWYEARLLEEGIEDMQNLLTGNLVDIILHTRVPVGRLVDWIDQAALHLLVDPPGNDQKERPTHDRNILRRLGIRTATDLETAFLPQERLATLSSWTAVQNFDDARLVDGIRTVLNGPEFPGVNVVEALLKAFSNTPNLVHVRHWRNVFCIDDELPPPAPAPIPVNGSAIKADRTNRGRQPARDRRVVRLPSSPATVSAE
jgi:hypothetical protein